MIHLSSLLTAVLYVKVGLLLWHKKSHKSWNFLEKTLPCILYRNIREHKRTIDLFAVLYSSYLVFPAPFAKDCHLSNTCLCPESDGSRHIDLFVCPYSVPLAWMSNAVAVPCCLYSYSFVDKLKSVIMVPPALLLWLKIAFAVLLHQHFECWVLSQCLKLLEFLFIIYFYFFLSVSVQQFLNIFFKHKI